MRKVLRVVKTPITLIALLAILGYGAWWGYKTYSVPLIKAADTCVMTDVGSALTPDKVTVRTYNGSEVPRLAKDARGYLLSWHFRVIDYNNSERRVPGIVVIGNSVNDPEVKLVQQFFPGSTAEADGRTSHVVDVILGTKFEQLNNPKATYPVKGPICLPAPRATPTGEVSDPATEEPVPSESASASPSGKPSKK
ncbi:LytR cell envelope-related transcriptional attenuator [Propionicimonas paludicola]|uniref:LytR cell envelope-related transcriptional attenuator n=1 Tax=Propionicimonas paludicola TaxID=185243 RepID=A0A2A9CW20_9ACTN|nr:LytR C-terminal domain-containing protein [Propionicimonas paludicola]PFG18336.1 LytR cell envelope-related transcriptional attenuator [Propionicimonas paludicola]